MSGLTWRVVTAVVLIPCVVWGILKLTTPQLALAFAAVILSAAWEWSALIGWTSRCWRWVYTLAFIPALYAVYMTTTVTFGWLTLLGLGLIWWFGAALVVVRFEQGKGSSAIGTYSARAVFGLFVLIPPWIALVVLHGDVQDGPLYLMFLMLLVWVADTSAFLVGRRWGARRLAPRVSPGKTWEGAIAGIVAVTILAVLAAHFLRLGVGHLSAFVILCTLVVPVSIVGDLVESLFKRQAGVKDSGKLLPGHGGVLDRIDSLAAAAPFFVVGLQWLRSVH